MIEGQPPIAGRFCFTCRDHLVLPYHLHLQNLDGNPW